MADNKKYYYLKLKDNFYDSEQMIILQNMQDGYLYSDILMKLYLRSLKTEGKLMFNNLIPYTPSVLAQVVRHQIGTVERSLKIFRELGLIEVLENGAIYMLDIQNFIGKSSTDSDRKRAYRTKINNEKLMIGQMSGQMSDKHPPEIEIEIELDKELELDEDIKETTGTKKGTKCPKQYYEDKQLNDLFLEFLEQRKKLKAINSDKAINTLLNILKNYSDTKKIELIERSMVNSWKSIFPRDADKQDVDLPKWLDKKIEKETATAEEQQEIENLLKDFT